MIFQRKVDRAMRYQKERNEQADIKKPTEEDKDKLSKKDLLAMILSAGLVILPVAALVLLAIAFGSYFLFFHIECAEPLDARSVDNVAISLHGEHFGESSGVHTFVMVRRNLAGLGFYARQYGIDKSRFADSRMSGE